MRPARPPAHIIALICTLALAGCGGGGGDGSSAPASSTGPGPRVDTTRPAEPGGSAPTINAAARLEAQPVLARVKPQALWNTDGVTGHGVRIAIDDDTVDILSPEFEGRIGAEGARLLVHFFPTYAYEAWRDYYLRRRDRPEWVQRLCPEGWRCRQFNVETYEDGEAAVMNALRKEKRYTQT